MKDLILITGSVMGANSDSVKTYEDLVSMIDTEKYKVSSPLDTMKFIGSDEERYQRAIMMLGETSMMIAEMSSTSTGQGIELGIAATMNIPVLVIAKEGSKVSGLVKGCPTVKGIVYYKDVKDIKEELDKFIGGENEKHSNNRR